MDRIALLYRYSEHQNDHATRFPSDKIKGNSSVIKVLFFGSYGDLNWDVKTGFFNSL